MAWQLSGQYSETCNCDVLCPCIYSNAKAVPTQGHCDAVLAFHVETGTFDGIDLAGLTAVVALQTDGPMAGGKGRREVYVDSRANEGQRRALAAVFSGEAGGPPTAMAQLAPEFLGVRYARVDFTMDGESRSLKVEGFGEMSLTGLRGAGGTMQIANAPHPVNTTLALARAGDRARFKDAAFDFNNAGKNGHFAPFDWRGE